MKNLGFELVKEEQVDEVEGKVSRYVHTKTGAQVLKILNSDENRVFTIGFRTPPADSTGIAHILEHSVLAGSRRYPLRDPFFELVKGSFNTFLNAYTCPDMTIYPCASQNAQDFMNLFGVYLDAVFYPRLNYDTFRREGWNYKLPSIDAPLAYGGIVFNEMKGARSGPTYQLNDAIESALYPGTQYDFDSGGDPEKIPGLTYEALVSFHRRYYHPSNSCTLLYGAGDAAQEFELLAEYFDTFEESAAVNLAVPTLDRTSIPIITRGYPIADDSDMKRKHWVTRAWAYGESNDPYLCLVAEFLSVAIAGLEGTPLKKAIIESGLGDAVDIGVSPYTYRLTLTCDVQGTDKELIPEVVKTVQKTLEEIAINGLDPELQEAVYKILLFKYRDSSNSGDRGMKLSSGLILPWLYGGDPYETMRYEALFERLKKDLPNLRSYVHNLFVENKHVVSVILEPEIGLDKKWAAAEEKQLVEASSQLTAKTRIDLKEATERLEFLSTEPDPIEILNLLPRIAKKDIPTKPLIFPVMTSESLPGLLVHESESHGVTYAHLAFDISHIPGHLLRYLAIFNDLLFSTGTAKRTYDKFAIDIASKTGGLSSSLFIRPKRSGGLAKHIILHGSALSSDIETMCGLMLDAITTSRIDDKERISQIIRETRQGMEHGIIPNGAAIALRRASSGLHPFYAYEEYLSGISNIEFIRNLSDNFDSEWKNLCDCLLSLREIIFNPKSFCGAITSEKHSRAVTEHSLGNFLTALPFKSSETMEDSKLPGFTAEGFTIPGDVNYVALAVPLGSEALPSRGSTYIAAQHVWGEYLLSEIRFQGGAYGTRAGFDYETGVFRFYSYRDPHLERTLEVYKKSADYLRTARSADSEILKSTIALISAEERPISASAKSFRGLADKLTERTNADREALRKDELSVTLKDIQQVGEVLAGAFSKAAVTVVGSEGHIKQFVGKKTGLLKEVKKLL